MDICCLQEVRWRSREARFVESGKGNASYGSHSDEIAVGILVKEKIRKQVVED